MPRRTLIPVRRGLLSAASAGLLLAAGLLAGTPALAAAPDDWPAGDWASECTDADSTYCIAEATLTPAGGDTVPLADLGMTASATALPDDWTTWFGWSVDGWDGQPDEVAGGQIRLVIRTGSFVPRFTTAVAAGLDVSRDVDDAANYTLTITGQAAQVDWTTGDVAADCVARQYCGEYDTMADPDGTGFRFQGKTQDLDGNSPDFIDAIDGAYVATDAQARTDMIAYDLGADEPYLWLGVLGNPQLDVNGDPVRNSLTAWLPDSYFTAASTPAGDALATGFDVVEMAGEAQTSVPMTATATGGGVRLDVPDIGVGAEIGELRLFNRPSRAGDGAAPGAPAEVTAIGSAGGAVVTWEAPESAGGAPITGYRARAFDAAAGGAVVSRCDAEADATSCEIAGLSDGETYHVAVTAISVLGEGRAGERVEATAGEAGAVPPSEPRTVRVAPGPARLLVTWAPPESDGGAAVESYTVRAYRTAAGGEPVADCGVDAAARSCVLTRLPSSARLYIGVTAGNVAGEGPEQAVRPYATAWTAPAAPRSVTARSSKNRITVSWAAPAATGGSPVTGYRAEFWTSASGGSAALKCTTSGSGRGCVTTALKPGRTYYVSVTALSVAGSSARTPRMKVLVRR
jgi:fibronectin type III domain protein